MNVITICQSSGIKPRNQTKTPWGIKTAEANTNGIKKLFNKKLE